MTNSSPTTASVQADWIQVTPGAAFSPRDTAEGVIYQDKMWISNAYYHGGKLTRDLWNSTDGKTWTEVSLATPYDGYSEMVVHQNKLWAVKRSVWRSDDGTAWSRILETTPFKALGYGELCEHEGQMFQIGPGPDVWSSIDGITWDKKTNTAPYGDRHAAAITTFAGKFWLMGGYTPNPNSPQEKGYKDFTTYNDVWCSSDGVHWQRVLQHAPWSPRMWTVAREYRNRLWLIGGYNNATYANLGDVWFTEDGITWTEFVTESVFTPRHEPTLYVWRGSLWVAAGNTWPVVNDVWRLTVP